MLSHLSPRLLAMDLFLNPTLLLERMKNHSNQSIKIPYLCHLKNEDLKYDYGDFHSFPFRVHVEPHVLLSVNASDAILERSASFLQSWCFFGLIINFFAAFSIESKIEDLIQTDADGLSFLDTRILPTLLRRVNIETRTLTSSQKSDLQRLPLSYLDAIQDLSDSSSDQVRSENIAGFTLLCVVLVVEVLGQAINRFIRRVEYCEIADSFPPDLMRNTDWCPSILQALREQLTCIPFCFLCTLQRNDASQFRHELCSTYGCIRDMINEHTYQTKHRSNCKMSEGCALLNPDEESVSRIVARDDIPLITAIETPMSDNLIDLTCSSKLAQPHYVCISHVWAQ